MREHFRFAGLLMCAIVAGCVIGAVVLVVFCTAGYVALTVLGHVLSVLGRL